MQILSRFLVVYLCLLLRQIDCGLVGDVFSAFNPLNILKTIDRQFTTAAPPTTSTVKTKLVSVEETVFHLAPTLQTLFEPNDAAAKLNYIVCPLSAISLLAQVLIGTHGPFHKYVSSFLEVKSKAKRQVQVFELTKDDLYDKKLYHSAFHWKLKRLMTSIRSSKSSTVVFENALVYNKNIQLVEHFPKHMKDYYKTEMIAVNPNEIDSRVLEWIQYNDRRRTPLKTTNFDNRAVLCSKFKFVSTWDTPFKEDVAEGPFLVTPFREINVKYLQATIKNTTYLDTNLFSLAVIPLKNHEFKLYVMLPADKNSQIRDFSESLRDFQFFKTMEHLSDPVDIELEMPKIFPYVGELDLMAPIRDDFRDRGYSKLMYIHLNAAAKSLHLTNAIQHLEISISNESEQLNSAVYETHFHREEHPALRQGFVEMDIAPNYDVQSAVVEQSQDYHPHKQEPYIFMQQPAGALQSPQQPFGFAQQQQQQQPAGAVQPPQQPFGFAQQQQQQLPQQPSGFAQQPSATYGGQHATRTVKFKVNSPFLFFIMHEKTRMVMVWGSIADPSRL